MHPQSTLDTSNLSVTKAQRLRSNKSCRKGYSFLEIAVTLPAAMVLTVCLGSVVAIALKSMPSKTNTVGTTLVATRVLDLMASEVSFASSITTDVTQPAAARQLTFLLPDRDGLAPSTETVTYSWSGTPGAPLQRTFNGNTVVVVNDVREFSLTYNKRTKTVSIPTTVNSGPIQLLSLEGASAGNFNTTTTAWPAEFIQPPLAANVTGWNVTRVDFVSKKDNTPTGTLSAQIRSATNRLPTNIVLSQTAISENALPSSYGPTTVNFTGMPMQPPESGVCFVLRPAVGSASPAGTISYAAIGRLNAQYVTTANSGTSWTASGGNTLRITVFGTVDTTTYTDSVQYLLGSVNCTLRVGASPASRLTAAFRIHNEPQVSGP